MVSQLRHSLLWEYTFVAAALLWAVARAQGPSVPIAYCASINTASTPANTSIYQSDGLCSAFCWDQGYSLAIVQDVTCWCSDYVPDTGDQVSTGQCDMSCPGYPTDLCGGDNLFGYMQDAKIPPLGTAGSGPVASGSTSAPVTSVSATTASEPSTTAPPPSSTTSVSSSSIISSTEVETETQQTVSSTVVSTSSPSPSTSTTSTSATLTSTTSTSGSSSSLGMMTSQQPVVQTVTVGGSVMTVTATPAATESPSSLPATTTNNGLAAGAIAGIVIGVVAVIAGILFIFFYLRRRRQEAEVANGPFDPSSKRGSSSAGMSGTPKTGDMAENRYVMGPEGRTMAENWENPQNMKRRSAMMPVDPRLDPFAKGIYGGTANKSRESLGSLQDNADYSRRVYEPKVLRATNPDPDIE